MNTHTIIAGCGLLFAAPLPAAAADAPAGCLNTLGSGDCSVALTLHWGDGKAIDNLTQAVRTEAGASVTDVLETALREDPRFYGLRDADGNYVAFGFDTNGDNSAYISLDGSNLQLDGGVASSADYASVSVNEYDHWGLNGDIEWKILVNGEDADYSTTLADGDSLTLLYANDATETLTDDFTLFYLRPADQQGIWMPENILIDTADGKVAEFPVLANICDDAPYLYGAKLGVNVETPEGVKVSNLYSTSFTYGNYERMICRITVASPQPALLRPFLNIRKDWDGSGKKTARQISGDKASNITTNVAHPLTGISLDGVEEGGVIELDYMGIAIIKPVYEPENADFTGYTATFEDPSVADIYKNVNSLVAHREGETLMTITTPDGSVSASYTIRVSGPRPDDMPDDFSAGTLWLNEDWFGHTSGSLNWLSPEGNLVTRPYGHVNNDMAFGATSLFATIYADRLVVMSKQPWDGGDTRPVKSGGRVVVAEANTLRHIGAIDDIGGDGRACVGVNPSKMYLGTTAGISILDLDNIEITGTVEGIELTRSGQIGNMVKSGKYVFAANIGTGLVAIDSETDEVVASYPASAIQGVVRSLDGRVWLATTNSLTPINPETLEDAEAISIPGSITCSSGSWRSVTIQSCRKSNELIWGNGTFYRWNLDEVEDPSTLQPVYTHVATVDDVKYGNPYGAPGYDEETDTYMYASMAGFGALALQNWYYFIDASTGEMKQRMQLPEYWWFPAMPVTADRYPAEINMENIIMTPDAATREYDLRELVTDKDGFDNAIEIWIENEDSGLYVADDSDADADSDAATIGFDGRTLTVTPAAIGKKSFVIAAESNGRVSRKTIEVEVSTLDGIGSLTAAPLHYVVYTTSGLRVAEYDGEEMPSLPAGVYIRTSAGKREKFVVK